MDDKATAPDWLPAMIVVALWGAIVPWVGPSLGIRLDSQMSARVVSHLVPGVAAAIVAALLWVRARRGIRAESASGALFLAVALGCGALMFALHVELLRDDFRTDSFPSKQVALHVTPGLLIIALSAFGIARAAGARIREP